MRRMEDKIRKLCSQLLATKGEKETSTILVELRNELHEHIERLRGRLSDYPFVVERRTSNALSEDMPTPQYAVTKNNLPQKSGEQPIPRTLHSGQNREPKMTRGSAARSPHVQPIVKAMQRELLVCFVCQRPVALEICNTNDLGQLVHEECYLLTLVGNRPPSRSMGSM